MIAPTIKATTDIAPNIKALNFIKRSWRGKEKLWHVFWIYGLLGGLAMWFTLGILLMRFGFRGIAVGITMAIIFYTWLIVALWRNAFNTRFRKLGYGVRTLAVLLALTFVSAIGFAGYQGRGEIKQMVAHRAQCEQQLQENASKQADPAAYVAQNQAWLEQCASNYAMNAMAGTVDSPEIYCQNRLKLFALQNGISDTTSYIKDNQALYNDCLAKAKAAHE